MIMRALHLMENPQTDYPKRIRNRMRINALLFLLGFAAASIAVIYEKSFVSDFLRGFYVGTGIGLMIAGSVMFLTNIRILKNSELMKRQLITETDERNRHIVQRAAGTSFFVLGVLLYIVLLFAGLFSLTVFVSVLGVLFLMFFVFIVMNFLFKSIY